MSKGLFRICPSHIQLGMFIAELDRPWLETPLPFQGFYVRDLAEVTWIQQNCAFVVVDTEHSDSALQFDYQAAEAGRSRRENKSLLSELEVYYGNPDTRGAHDARQQTRDPHKRRGLFNRLLGRHKAAPLNQAMIRKKVGDANGVYQASKAALQEVQQRLRAGGTLDLQAVEKAIHAVIDSVLQGPDAMACVVRMKEAHEYRHHHSLDTAIWAVMFGNALGFDSTNLEVLGLGGFMLDIGKTRIPSELLTKTGPLTPVEIAAHRRHVQHSLDLLHEAGLANAKIAQMVSTHHERHDGSGYPRGLAGNAIPVLGRIAGLVDTYDALTSDRPHIPAQSTYHVLQTLLSESDGKFQSELVERFIQVVGIFPTASMVELNTGEVGIVVEQNTVRRLRPKVMLVTDEDKRSRAECPVLVLDEVSADASEPGSRWIVRAVKPGAHGIEPREHYL